ncbi:MAG: ABC transporter permease [Clostridia bacterium]|nr:ABC transporter permease [Clostridia bacterium]
MNFAQLLNQLPGAVAQGLIWGVMAIGVYITFRILDIADLTVDGSIATGGAVAAILITQGVHPWLAALIAFLAGMAAGAVTGVFHTVMGIPAILAGILTQLALYSVNLRIQGIGTDLGSRANVPLSINKYKNMLVSLRNVGSFTLENPIWLMLLITAVLIGLMYWFFGTEYGCGLRAVGANPQMARAQGINTNSGKLTGLMISNGIVAFCGALMAQYQGFSDVSMGRGAIVIGLAAVIIGEVIFGKLFRNFALKLLAVSIGAIIYYLVIQIVLWLGLNTDDLKLLTALVVALFLAAPHWKTQVRIRRTKGGEKL